MMGRRLSSVTTYAPSTIRSARRSVPGPAAAGSPTARYRPPPADACRRRRSATPRACNSAVSSGTTVCHSPMSPMFDLVEYLGVGVGVDSQDHPGIADADRVVEAAAGADRHQQSRSHRVAGHADLAAAGHPSLVGHPSGGAQRGAAQSVSQLVDDRIALGVRRPRRRRPPTGPGAARRSRRRRETPTRCVGATAPARRGSRAPVRKRPHGAGAGPGHRVGRWPSERASSTRSAPGGGRRRQASRPPDDRRGRPRDRPRRR